MDVRLAADCHDNAWRDDTHCQEEDMFDIGTTQVVTSASAGPPSSPYPFLKHICCHWCIDLSKADDSHFVNFSVPGILLANG